MPKPSAENKKRFREYLGRLCRDVRKLYFADEYSLEFAFTDDPPVVSKGNIIAAIDCDPIYLNLKIYITSRLYQMWETGDYHGVVDTILHEFAHIYTEPLWAITRKAKSKEDRASMVETWERQTQRISNLVMSLIVEPDFWPRDGERPKAVKKPPPS